jgi:ribosomal protein L21
MTEIRQYLTISGNIVSGTVRDIPAGANRFFTLNGYDASGTLTYTGSSVAEVIPGENITVRITLKRLSQAPDNTTNGVFFEFNGTGNGTTGSITLDHGVYTVQVDKPSSDAISLELLDANTGQKILFNWSDLMSLEGRNQTSIGKSFVIANDGDYIINIRGSSGLGAWSMLIETATTQTLGTSGLRFQGEGNGTTGVITLESGAHTVQVDKPSSDAISLELLDANTGQKILFNWSDLMSLEGRNQTSIGKSFVIANDGDYIINISGSSGFGAWEMIIR